MPNTGEKPGKGEYTCENCGQVVVLDDDTDKSFNWTFAFSNVSESKTKELFR